MKLPTQTDWDKLYSTNGNFATQKMFWEYGTPASRDKFPPVYTLKPRPHMGLPSAYQVYMESIDEYDAAKKLAPNLKVWDDLKAVSWFLNGDAAKSHDGLVSWREHMKARDASLARDVLQEAVREGSVQAAGRLLTESKSKEPVGRKTKKNTTIPNATVSRIKDFQNKQGN